MTMSEGSGASRGVRGVRGVRVGGGFGLRFAVAAGAAGVAVVAGMAGLGGRGAGLRSGPGVSAWMPGAPVWTPAASVWTAEALAAEAATIRSFGSPGELPEGPFAYGSDLDGDRTPDVAVTIETGVVRVYSGASGIPIRDFAAPNPGNFGRAIAFSPDVNGDGVDDLLVGATGTGRSTDPPGAVILFSGATGLELRRGTGTFAFSRFGTQVVALGDVTGDGVPDFAGGGPGALNAFPGEMLAFSGADGSLLPALSRQGTGTDNLGASMVAVGDVNGDGVPDVAVGSPGAYRASAGAFPLGRVDVVSGKDGRTIRTLRGKAPYFGYLLANAGDFDGDGAVDLAATSDLFTTVSVVSTRTWRTVRRIARPEEGTNFARFLAAGGDLDGDGRGEILATVQIGGAEFLHVFGSASRGAGSIARIDPGTSGYMEGARIVPDEDNDGVADALVSFNGHGLRVLHVDAAQFPSYAFALALTRPQAQAALTARGTFGVKVSSRSQTVSVTCAGLSAGATYTVHLEDAPASDSYDTIGTLTMKGTTGALTLTGTGTPPAALGLTSLAQVAGRHVQLRDAMGTVVLDGVLPLPGPVGSSNVRLPLARAPGTTFTSVTGSMALRYTPRTGALLFTVAVRGVPTTTPLALEIESPAGSDWFVAAGAFNRLTYSANTGAGQPLPGGATSSAGLSGRKVRVVSGAETVLVGQLP